LFLTWAWAPTDWPADLVNNILKNLKKQELHSSFVGILTLTKDKISVGIIQACQTASRKYAFSHFSAGCG
jgi:hypothetical protein